MERSWIKVLFCFLGAVLLVEGEEAVAAVDDVGEDDEAAKIDFFAVAIC